MTFTRSSPSVEILESVHAILSPRDPASGRVSGERTPRPMWFRLF